jgi:hypothetical protein
MLAMELIPAIRERMAALDAERRSAVASGHRAALWRAQSYAANFRHTMEDLRRYALDSLAPRRYLEEDDYLRGYRKGFQAVLAEIRRIRPPTTRAP